VVSFADVLMAPILVDVLPRVVESLPLLNAAYYLDILVGLLLVAWYVRASRRNPRLDRRSLTRVSVGVLGAGRVLAVPTARAERPCSQGVARSAVAGRRLIPPGSAVGDEV
jgi:hypothetical protein